MRILINIFYWIYVKIQSVMIIVFCAIIISLFVMLIGSNCILRIFFFLKQCGGERVMYQNLIEVVQLLSPMFVTPRTAAQQASLCFTVSLSLLRLMSIEPLMPSSHLILCVPLHLGPQSFQHQGLIQSIDWLNFLLFIRNSDLSWYVSLYFFSTCNYCSKKRQGVC